MSEHRTEMRMREIGESFCLEPGCEYEGKPSIQGHCHSRLDEDTDRIIARMETSAESSLAFYREQHPDDAEYLKTLESMYVCAMMNWEGALDQLVRLRRENAELKRGQAMTPSGARAGRGGVGDGTQ